MFLQAILHRTGSYKTLSLRCLSTSRHELSDSINICCIFFHSLIFLPHKESTAHSGGHLSFSVPLLSVRPVLVWVQLLWKVNALSPRRSHCSRRWYWSGGLGGAGEVWLWFRPSLGVSGPLGVWRSEAASAGKSRSTGSSPKGSLLVEVSQPFSGHWLRAAACCLPWGPSPSPFLEVSQKVAIKPVLCLTSRRLNFRTRYLYSCPDPDSLSKLTLNLEWFRYEFCTPKLCVCFVWSMCSLPSLIFLRLLACIVLSAC